jgi:hypothetical protein
MRPLAAALAALATALLLAAPAALAEDFKVVVHPDNPAAEIDRQALSRLFLKRTLRWPDGTPAEPVEPAAEPLRARFADAVHGKRLAAVRAWWNQQIFSGRDVPPLEKQGDAEVVAWVRAHRGGVGSVGAGADTAGTKVLPVVK